MILIENDGQAIKSTNYWDSETAKRGYYYLSWNAGAARLMVPDALFPSVSEMRSARYVIISRGPWKERDGRDALELLFEDGSSSPYVLHLTTQQQTDRSLPETDQGGGVAVTVWTRDGEQLRLPGKYRTVLSIPCLSAWKEQ